MTFINVDNGYNPDIPMHGNGSWSAGYSVP
jgi:hypothetical protein